MAVAVSTTQSVSPSMSASGGGGRIEVLLALRRCLLGAIDALTNIEETPEIAAALVRRCNELARIERDILQERPKTIQELCLQAELVRESVEVGDFDAEGTLLLLANIRALAA